MCVCVYVCVCHGCNSGDLWYISADCGSKLISPKMVLVPKNVGNAYANKQRTHDYLSTLIVCYQVRQLLIKALSCFR